MLYPTAPCSAPICRYSTPDTLTPNSSNSYEKPLYTLKHSHPNQQEVKLMVKKKSSEVPKPVQEPGLLEKIGHFAFLTGAAIAILAGIYSGTGALDVEGEVALFTTLFTLGFIVGILNVTVKETTRFLVAAIALILAGIVRVELIPEVGVYIRAILSNIVVFVVPAALIVGIRAVWLLAKEK